MSEVGVFLMSVCAYFHVENNISTNSYVETLLEYTWKPPQALAQTTDADVTRRCCDTSSPKQAVLPPLEMKYDAGQAI